MHIPDAVLDPKVAAITGAVGAAGLLYAVRKLERQLGERTTVLMGTMAAFVFAAQMVTFPVGLGVSGHLLGGVLSAVLLGPWAGALVIGAVLIVQCFLFNDGGVTALGANFINMGLIGSVGGYAIYAPIRRAIGGPQGTLIAAMVAAWFSVLLASGAFAIELAASGDRRDFFQVLAWMALVHAVIGVGEALITGMVVRFVLLRRPDLLEPEDGLAGKPARGVRWGQTMIAGLAVALGVAVFLAPFASESPDGLEYVGRAPRLPDRRRERPVTAAPVADGRLSAQAARPGPREGGDRAGGRRRDAGRLRPRLGHGTRPAACEAGRGDARCGLTRWSGTATASGPLQRLDARVKLIAALALILAVIAMPIGAWRWYGIAGLLLAFVIGLAGHPAPGAGAAVAGPVRPGGLPRRDDRAGASGDRTPRPPAVAASILIKNGLAVMTMIVLAGTTPFPRLLTALRKLGVPPVLVATLQFMERYRHVLVAEVDRMATARRARSFGRRGVLSWSLLGGLIGMLFLRTFERAERVHDAMIARGWDGTIRGLDD